jgi:hypothetical protein
MKDGIVLLQTLTFRTVSGNTLSLLTVGCNDVRGAYADLWPDARFQLNQGVETGNTPICVHLGDQIYADGIHNRYENESSENRYAEILEAFRELYRINYSHHSQAEVMRRCSNLMISDDHEICNDYGPHRQPNPLVARAGLQAMYEYQVQFRLDVQTYNEPLSYTKRIGNTQMIFLDTRVERYRQQLKGYLTDDQRELLLDVRAEVARERTLDVLLFISRPLFATSTFITSFGDGSGPREHTSHKENLPDTMYILDQLDQLRHSNPDINLVVVGGDMHMGTVHRFRRNGQQVFTQLTTSGITKSPESDVPFWSRIWKWFKYNTICCATTISAEEDDNSANNKGWSYTEDTVTMDNNFGHIKTLPGKTKLQATIWTKRPDKKSARPAVVIDL